MLLQSLILLNGCFSKKEKNKNIQISPNSGAFLLGLGDGDVSVNFADSFVNVFAA
jgi:hypothetical protein